MTANLDHIIPSLHSLAVPIDDLHLDPANARTGHALDRIAASLSQYKQRKPVVVNRNEGNKIEAGNGTWQAAKMLGWAHIAAVFVEDDPSTAVGYGVADNRLSDLSTWDINTLDLLIAGLDPDLNLPTGFDEGELDALIASIGAGVSQEPGDAEPQTNRANELQEQWQTETGQLWRLPSRNGKGEHRLIVGDCTDREVVERLADGRKFDMMFTDPPYGVEYTGGHFHSGDVNIKRERERLAGDDVDMYGRFLPVVVPYIDGPCYVWFAASVGKPVYDAILGNGCEIHAMIVWHKVNAKYAAMNAQYKQRHEPCIYFKPKRSTLRWIGATDECTIWEIKRDSVNEYHPTQKPTELAYRAIANHDVITVADFFAGSGSTLIACENLGRYGRAVEISPAYCAVILQRYQDAFGITPELVTP